MVLQQETMAVFVISDAQALPQDIGILLEGQVQSELPSVQVLLPF